MKKIDYIIKEILTMLKINNKRTFKFTMNDQCILSNSKAFLYNTIHIKNKVEQKPVSGIYYKDFDSMRAMVEVCGSMSIVYWMYCQIFNRNLAMRGVRNYSFTVKVNFKAIEEATGLSYKTVSRYLADCVERDFIFPEENGEYSMNPRFCPWENIEEVLTWNEEEIYQRTKNEPDGIKKKYMSKNCTNLNDYNIPILAAHSLLKKYDYEPQPIDYVLDYVRSRAIDKVFPVSINLVFNHASSLSLQYNFKSPSKSTISRTLSEFMKTRTIVPQGIINRQPVYSLSDPMSLSESDRINALINEIEVCQPY